MIIQIILTSVVALLMLAVSFQTVSSRGLRRAVQLTLTVGIYFIWFPAHTNEIANAVGIGRGADLLLYFWILISFASLFFVYLKIHRVHQTVTQLARAVALASPMYPETEDEKNAR